MTVQLKETRCPRLRLRARRGNFSSNNNAAVLLKNDCSCEPEPSLVSVCLQRLRKGFDFQFVRFNYRYRWPVNLPIEWVHTPFERDHIMSRPCRLLFIRKKTPVDRVNLRPFLVIMKSLHGILGT